MKEEWEGEFGDNYTKRNRVDWRKRADFWYDIINKTGSRSVFEFGCNAGWNLTAIQRLFPGIMVYGHEINTIAAIQAEYAGIELVEYRPHPSPAPIFDITFTAGVLIHIPPDELEEVMKNIAGASSDYVLAVEYASEQGNEEMVTYRGKEDMLWKRDYGKLYQELGLELIESGYAGEGFDACTYWLLRHKSD